MSDWIKLIATAAISIAIFWNMVQQHEYRLNQVESGFGKHLEAHNQDLKEIRSSLSNIDIKITRMESDNGR